MKTTFLHGDLVETMYMHQSEGFVMLENKDKVCLLKKSLYELKQSPRQWCKKFDYFMTSIGFIMCRYDSCVHFAKEGTSIITYLLLYVDDMLIAS